MMTGEETVENFMGLTVGYEHCVLTAEESAEFQALRVDLAQRLDALTAARKAAEPLRMAWLNSECAPVTVPVIDICRLMEALGFSLEGNR